MRSFMAKAETIKRNWYLLDAKDKVLGRFASRVARILMGKDKPTFTPHIDQGDFVVVINAKYIKVTGKKLENKVYYHHTFYPGGLKQKRLKDLLKERPERVIELAVKRMLPKNRHQARRMRRLKVYADETHPHHAQSPVPIT
uniref:Large ribosomal subunit protein uL13 n=1 Tax=candidate division WOR-3 bacterium TaxID=2052148 RepID=A0A7C6EFA7_UNCW3